MTSVHYFLNDSHATMPQPGDYWHERIVDSFRKIWNCGYETPEGPRPPRQPLVVHLEANYVARLKVGRKYKHIKADDYTFYGLQVISEYHFSWSTNPFYKCIFDYYKEGQPSDAEISQRRMDRLLNKTYKTQIFRNRVL